ncbi:MAG: methyltransferase domain-containing protein [Candidatus Hodarchaeales archaeon]|jgi:magnesium-protoporphyrin O-methyltransferase
MICPQCQGIEQTFNQKTAQKELRDFRKKGARKQTRFLLDAIMAEGMKETLLDIGGGVGTIQHELLRSGMSQAINVDASSAYSAAAKEEAERLEHADRISFHQGDFVDVASQIPPTDVVTLDRVICCYHNMEGLVASSSRHAKEIYGIIYPRESWWMKPLFSMFNFVQKIMRKTFRVFIHKRRDIVAILDTENFESYYYKKAGIWQIEAFKRQL